MSSRDRPPSAEQGSPADGSTQRSGNGTNQPNSNGSNSNGSNSNGAGPNGAGPAKSDSNGVGPAESGGTPRKRRRRRRGRRSGAHRQPDKSGTDGSSTGTASSGTADGSTASVGTADGGTGDGSAESTGTETGGHGDSAPAKSGRSRRRRRRGRSTGTGSGRPTETEATQARTEETQQRPRRQKRRKNRTDTPPPGQIRGRRRTRSGRIEEVSSGGLVVDDTGDEVRGVLIGKHDRRGRLVWSLPKGHVELGETLEQTAVREIEEETGVTAEVRHRLGEVDYWFMLHGEKIHKTVHHFLLRYVEGELSDRDVEVVEVAWVPLDEIPTRLAYPDERRLVAQVPGLLSRRTA